MPGAIVLPAFVVDSTLTTKGDLSPFVVNSTLTVKGELAPFVVDASLDATTYLDLAPFVINGTTSPRWLAPFQVLDEQNFLDGTIPIITASLSSDNATNTIAASLPVLQASLGYAGGVVAATMLVPQASLNATDNISASLTVPRVGFWFDEGQHIAANLTTITTSMSGLVGQTGEISAAMLAPTPSIVGGSYAINAPLTLIDSYISSSTNAPATIAATMPLQSASISGIVTGNGEIDARTTRLSSSITGLVGVTGSVDAQIVVLRPTINALLGASASLDSALALITADLAGYLQASATVSAQLPVITVSITGTVSVELVAAYVVNTITNALTVYDNFAFNSLVQINGKYYGASPDGVFELVGAKDNTGVTDTNVDATISTGHLHFGSEMQKRMSDFYIAMRSDGNITLNVSVDERDPYEYTLSPYDIELLKQRRSLIGKGLKGKYWRFTLTNEDGCDFDFDSINAAAVILSRRL